MIFAPDSPFVARYEPSPNHGERRNNAQIDMLVLHYTGMQTADEALARLCSPESQVSAHYVIFEDGHMVQCVPEERRAWHAGVSEWAGQTDINSCSIGIEIANPGHYLGYPDFPDAQIGSVLALSGDILARREIAPQRVLGHSDIAPARKQDPGEKFPWQKLHDAGIGLWVEPDAIVSGPVLALGDKGSAVAALQQSLYAYGYGVDQSGDYDALTRDVVTAFQRHFRPVQVDGVADVSTVKTLQRLIAARAALLRSQA